jgi:hypothetical protein
MRFPHSSVLIATLIGVAHLAVGADRFPFVIPGLDASSTVTDFSNLNHSPAGKHGFVRITDGHFTTDAGRLRVWGVNLSFGANFPTHDEADKAAAHLAKLGINGVRIHHHETSYSPRGLFNKNGTWDPQQIDRLDYLLARLHEHGIYANLNLHVGRRVSQQLKLPQLGTQHYLMYDKPALHFYPPIQNAFWKFCREYLGHLNPYRKLRRADDPGIAMLEIANENRFSLADPGPFLRAPEPFRSELGRRWNTWLKDNFATTAAIRRNWAAEETTTSARLTDSTDWQHSDLGPWDLSDNGGKSPIELIHREDSAILRFEPGMAATQGWHQQFSAKGLSFGKGVTYLLRFRARSDRARTVGVNSSTTKGGKWEPLGLSTRIDLSPAWKEHTFRFVAPKNVSKAANVAFDIGGSQTPWEISDLDLRSGGNWITVPEGQSLIGASIDLPGPNSSPKAQESFKEFMFDTEHEFYRRTKELLKNELGIRVPITTTQINYQPAKIANEIADFSDMHAYWHHPIFPGKSWDGSNWHIQNETLVAFPFHNKWPRVNMAMRAPWRLLGKPFTFSEWNTGEPGFFSADAIPIAALMAGLQDWDAVFFFNYKGSAGNWDTDHIGGYFDVNGQPAKLALITALANLYRRADLTALRQYAVASDGQQENLGALALTHLLATDPNLPVAKSHPAPTDVELSKLERKLVTSPNRSVHWDARNPNTAHVIIETPRTVAVWGLIANQSFKVGPFNLDFGDCERDYAVFVATSLDNRTLDESDSILVTVVGNAENQAMGWNADRTSVGTRWGHGPTLGNGISVNLKMNGRFRCHALTGTGSPQSEVRISDSGFPLSAAAQTLWYHLRRR